MGNSGKLERTGTRRSGGLLFFFSCFPEFPIKNSESLL